MLVLEKTLPFTIFVLALYEIVIATYPPTKQVFISGTYPRRPLKSKRKKSPDVEVMSILLPIRDSTYGVRRIFLKFSVRDFQKEFFGNSFNDMLSLSKVID